MRHYRHFLTLLLLCWSITAFAQTRQFGNITYPAKGNIQLDEGTVELWIVCGFDSEDIQTAAATYFNLMLPDENGHYILNHISWGHSLAMVGYVLPQQSYVWSEKLKWKPGEPHHIAWSWSGRKRSVYVDGKIGKGLPGHGALQGEGRVDTSENVIVEGVLHGDLTNAQLLIGRGHSLFTIDELRVSSVARPLADIQKQMNSAPVADAQTLLLDHCDGGPAAVIAGFSGETGGKLEGKFKIVDTQHGKGIALWTE